MKILTLLKQDKASLDEKRALRKAKALKRKQEALIDKLEGEKDDIADKLDKLNTITVDSINDDSWVNDMQECTLNLTIKEKEIEVAKKTMEEYFTEDKA